MHAARRHYPRRRIATIAAVLSAPVLPGLALAHAQAQAGSPAPVLATPAATAFVDVSVIPMDRERVLRHQTVLVQGTTITALGPATRIKLPVGAQRIDGRGKYLIPGLSDMHYHIAVDEASLDRAAIERQLFFLVANGVTTMRLLDYWDKDGANLRLRAQTATGQLLGPRIYTAGWWRGDAAQSIEQNVAAYKAAGYDFIKIHNEMPATLDTLLPIARRLGMPVMGHVLNRDTVELTRQELARALAAPYASIEHLTGYPGDINGPNSADAALLPALAAATKRAGVWNCPTQSLIDPDAWDTLPDVHYKVRPPRPAGQDQPPHAAPDTADPRVRGFHRLVELRRRMIKALQDAGAGLLIGTDTPLKYQEPGFGVHRELVALVVAGLTPYQALVAGTRNAAAYFGTLDSAGTVAAGRRADLLLLAANPLVDIHNTRRSAGVMVGGRWLPQEEIDQRLAQYVAARP